MTNQGDNPSNQPKPTMNDMTTQTDNLDAAIRTAASHANTEQPLTAAELPYVLPQHLNRTVYEKRTKAYDLFESDTIIQNLQRMDFVVRDAITQKARGENGGGKSLTRHLYRLCRRTDFGKSELPELVLVNSHNGACSLRVYTGYFRLICENGMICGGRENLRIRHMGHSMEEVLSAIRGVAETFSESYAKVDAFKTKFLSDGEIRDFGRKANEIRVDIGLRPVDDPLALVAPRRAEDSGNDLWSVFNRTQENLMKGGLELTKNAEKFRMEGDRMVRTRNRQTRPIRNIIQNVGANTRLWTLAEEFYTGKPVEISEADIVPEL